jgi:ABC-type sulfate/molybdate transport systems ATPase subunit
MSDQVLVMNQGRIEEIADADTCTPILKRIYKDANEAIPTGSKD